MFSSISNISVNLSKYVLSQKSNERLTHTSPILGGASGACAKMRRGQSCFVLTSCFMFRADHMAMIRPHDSPKVAEKVALPNVRYGKYGYLSESQPECASSIISTEVGSPGKSKLRSHRGTKAADQIAL